MHINRSLHIWFFKAYILLIIKSLFLFHVILKSCIKILVLLLTPFVNLIHFEWIPLKSGEVDKVCVIGKISLASFKRIYIAN